MPILEEKKPVIGYNVESNFVDGKWESVDKLKEALYTESIFKAGGIPRMFTFDTNVDKAIEEIDGYLLTGGKDLPYYVYNTIAHEKTNSHKYSRERYYFEKEILEKSRKRKIPVLGVCLGLQLMNVAGEGTLEQHIEGHSSGSIHTVNIVKDSLVGEIIGNHTIKVKCYHHQSVQKLNPDFKISGFDEHNLPHIIESTVEGEWVVGVQFHPERYQENVENCKIFQAFVSKAAELKRSVFNNV